MREILFHGKRLDNGEWVEGYLIEDKEFYGQSDKHSYIVNHKHPSSCFGRDIYYEVNPETVGQYTGKTDENEKKIFDGDIVYVAGEDENAVIEWDEDTARYIIKFDGWVCDFDNFYGYDLEVIGNCWDNPELLKDGE